jgi:polyisoprenoid-binding protein YceI
MDTIKWTLDAAHSEIQFKVKHLMISTVTGQFNKFEGSVESEGNNFSTAKAFVSIDVNSISTNNEQRDQHLRTNDFFDAENFPKLTFESVKIVPGDNENYKIHGALTMRGVSKDIAFEAEVSEVIKDPWGNERIGISANGKLNRKDFGVSFGMLTETGGIALGDEVKFLINTEFVRQAQITSN